MSAPPRPAAAGFGGLCPQCGAKTLYAGLLRFAPTCRACGLDFDQFNVGDGPAAFLTLGIGTLVTILALLLELTVHPPAWVHLVVWLPLSLAGVIGGLRIAKAWLLALEYHNRAHEGRLER